MADRQIKTRLIARNDTAANWTSQNPVLLRGELGVEIDTGKIKYGDGVKTWTELPYSFPAAEDIQVSHIDGMAATTVQEAVAENFRSVVDGKNLLETAVIDKGGTVEKVGSVATFAELKTGISGVPTGGENECTITFDYYNPAGKSGKENCSPLSQARKNLAGASAGNKAIFAGGHTGSAYTNIVESLDLNSNLSSFPNLTYKLAYIAAVTFGENALFAGGLAGANSYSKVVESYAETGTRQTYPDLTNAVYYSAAATAESKVIIAGGNSINGYVDTVNVYTKDGTKISFPSLSSASFALCGTTVGKIAVFAGGGGLQGTLNTVEAYSANGVRTAFSSLSTAKRYAAAAFTYERAIIAGGVHNNTSYYATVDAYTESGTYSSFPNLSQPKANLAGTSVGGKVIFAGGTRGSSTSSADSYDDSGLKVALADLSLPKAQLAATTVGNAAIFAGGVSGSTCYSTVESYFDDSEVDISILGGGIYNFGKGENAAQGSMIQPTVVKVQKPVNGYVKYKGAIISG